MSNEKPTIWPHNIEAEQSLIGAVLHDDRAFDRVAEIIRPDDFYFLLHARMYEHIEILYNRGERPTVARLVDYFTDDPDFAQAGGVTYLQNLVDYVLSPQGADEWARLIHDLRVRRGLIEASLSIKHDATHADIKRTPADMIAAAEAMLFDLSDKGELERGAVSLSQAMQDALHTIDQVQKGELRGIPTGLKSLDYMLGGLWNSDLYILGGRPSMGKTVRALDHALAAAEAGHKVLIFSQEMSAQQLAQRYIARHTGAPVQAQNRVNGLSPEMAKRVFAAAAAFEDLDIFIDDTPGLNINQIRTRARRHKRQNGLDFAIIDHLHLMGDAQNFQSDVSAISQRTKGAKYLAKELAIPVLLLAQLNRGVEQREDKRPMMADLRDGGSIEQDADVIMFLFREEYYLERSEPKIRQGESAEKFGDRLTKWQKRLDKVRGQAEIIVAKLRQGAGGPVRVGFNGQYQKFYDLDIDRADYQED